MEQMTECKVHSVNILALIDTDYIICNHGTNDNPADPQRLSGGSQYLLCTGARGAVSGQGTNKLTFSARKGDHAVIRCLSFTNNSDGAVILYNIHQKKDSHIFRPFTFDEEELTGAVEPNTSSSNGLPAQQASIDFSSFDSKIKRSGTASLLVQFGVYIPDPHNRNIQSLYGYFEWEIHITVE